MTDQGVSPLDRLGVLEGLRGFLALYVVLDHSLEYSGYVAERAWSVFYLRAGHCAVDVFIILSGFVIFCLLDKRTEDYRTFLMRRFLRLYPVAIVMFAVAVPVSLLRYWNVTHADAYSSAEQIHAVTSTIHSWWDHWLWNTLLHGTLLHGVVPDGVLPHASEAFLDPAWSISLEWQFYLVAPLCYMLATKSRSTRLLLCLGCAAIVLVRPWLPSVLHGAALQFHVEYFFIGAASYFFFKRARGRMPRASCLWAAGAAGLTMALVPSLRDLAPLCLWLVMLCLLCGRDDDRARRWLGAPLEHPWAQALGRVSYSVYLAHLPLLAVVQFGLLTMAPGLDRVTHACLLFAGTVLVTLPVASVLYATIEAPFIRWGKAIAQSWQRAPVPVPARARFASES